MKSFPSMYIYNIWIWDDCECLVFVLAWLIEYKQTNNITNQMSYLCSLHTNKHSKQYPWDSPLSQGYLSLVHSKQSTWDSPLWANSLQEWTNGTPILSIQGVQPLWANSLLEWTNGTPILAIQRVQPLWANSLLEWANGIPIQSLARS